MIRYTLSCDAGHEFDSWFRDMAASDHQLEAGFLACPACGSARVAKALMAPAVRTSRALAGAPTETAEEHPAKSEANVALLDARQTEIRGLLTQLRQKVLTETQDVGRLFPDQARRMHEGDIPMRQIRGQATPDEARDLLEDGVLIMPLPSAPDDLN